MQEHCELPFSSMQRPGRPAASSHPTASESPSAWLLNLWRLPHPNHLATPEKPMPYRLKPLHQAELAACRASAPPTQPSTKQTKQNDPNLWGTRNLARSVADAFRSRILEFAPHILSRFKAACQKSYSDSEITLF